MTEEKENKKIVNLTFPVLAILLTLVAFLAGTFWAKMRSLEKEDKGEAAQGAQVSPAPQGPEENRVLGAEEKDKISQGGAAVKGKENAPITIVEFSEYQCPFCQRYVDEAYAQIWEEYGDKVRYLFRDYPLGFHPHAQKMAEVARCAGDQERYWEMHDLLFTKRDDWANQADVSQNVVDYGRQLGLKQSEFDDCVTSGKHTQAVKDDFALGQSVGVSGTPTFFINGQMIVGAQPFAAFKAIIDQELAD